MAAAIKPGAPSLLPTRLQCDFRTDPVGIDSTAPRLDWILQPTDPFSRGLVQSAYQILVSSSPQLLAQDQGDLWDSAKIISNRSNQIPYAGKWLAADQSVWWKVRAWDGKDTASDWSLPATWTMGVLKPSDWHAKWITAPARFKGDDNSTFLVRHEFEVKPGLVRATVNICGLGQYEMKLNGINPTSNLLTPGWTKYDKTCLYDTYDITALLHPGSNAVGLLLGNGMYRVGKGRYAKFQGTFGPLKAIARIRLEYADGSSSIVGTDTDWHVGVSPMTFASVYGGEDWDARMQEKGWDGPGFDDSKWSSAELCEGPGGTLKGTSNSAPPIRAFEVHQPISHREITPHVTIYDLGQEASHMTRFTAHGPAGSTIRVTPSELLQPDGSLFRNNYNGKAWSIYTLAGTGAESYTSKFYYCGDRYLQVECAAATQGGEVPVVDSIEGIVVHSSTELAGGFSCSNDLFNRIYTMIHWSQVSNMMSVISDCPHRERLGWLEQDNLHGPSLYYKFDMRPLAIKVIADMSDCQLDNGLIPTSVPEYHVFPPKWRDSIEWGSSGVLMPWQEYQATGDLEVLRRNYPMMKRYVEHITSMAKGGIAARGIGDWSGKTAIIDKSPELISTAFYYEDAQVLARSARLLGNDAEAATEQTLADTIREAFIAAFFHPDTNQYGTGSQAANSFALDLGLVLPAHRAAVLDNLLGDLKARKYAMTVGEIGLPYMLRALASAGRSDIVYAINNQTDNPGYGYQLKMGATALCETWDGNRDNCQIQLMLGDIVEWFFHDLAGIQSDPDRPGYSHIIIHPTLVGDLIEVKASYDSVRGKIVSEWKREGDRVTLHVIIPPNTSATVCVPASSRESVTQGGKPAADAASIKFLQMSGSYAQYGIGSGDYTFGALWRQ
jgi:alpha-L-rhamnosidase